MSSLKKQPRGERSDFLVCPERSTPSLSRRRFLHSLSSSLAMAGLVGCTRPPAEETAPYVRQPEHLIPGKPLYFATATLLGGIARGVLVESHEGRPTKVEGNPLHPTSPGPSEYYEVSGDWGATDIFSQASILDLYDPDRAKTVKHQGRIDTWEAFLEWVQTKRSTLEQTHGNGFRFLTPNVTSPTLISEMETFLEKYPEAKWHVYEPLHDDAALEGSRMAFGEPVESLYRFDRAQVVVSLDSDFLGADENSVRYAHDFMKRRREGVASGEMNRLYCVESTFTSTGATADHRLPLRPSRIRPFAIALAGRLGIGAPDFELDSYENEFLEKVVKDLKDVNGGSLVIPGRWASPEVHALAHAINGKLGAVGKTVECIKPLAPNEEGQVQSLAELTESMEKEEVQTLVILDGNPAYDSPADIDFESALDRVEERVYLGLYENETSALCHWSIPSAHPFESWGDARAFDGTVTLLQPLIAPLYDGRTGVEILAALLNRAGMPPYQIVKEYWRNRFGASENFEKFWKRALHDGVVPETKAPLQQVELKPFDLEPIEPSEEGTTLELAIRPDPTVWDGRFNNNGWLQELPKPITQLTWENAALIGPRAAEELGLHSGDVCELIAGDRLVEAPILILPGQPDGSVTVHLGYGRRRTGAIGAGAGFNAYRLRTAVNSWSASGVSVAPTGRKHEFAITQDHHRMEGRDLARSILIADLRVDHPAGSHSDHYPTLYDPFDYEGIAWGMNIDLTSCTGCNACVIACQAENSIPVVGKEEVQKGREMHWIRIDKYIEERESETDLIFQPVTCMHCENAPCETVCPVGATQHSHEGLNEMVYNRCIGTRYCSNNCPYKVRRFNFFQYADRETESLKLQRNPDVTVRERGVMEKCTYCVQRISHARIEAKKEHRPIRDGEVVTACQAVCPTEAIVFGNLNDPDSAVSRRRNGSHCYDLLAELGVKPRTSYLARIKNPIRDGEEG